MSWGGHRVVHTGNKKKKKKKKKKTIYTNDENLFTLKTSLINHKDYNINNINLKLCNARLGHYNGQNLQKFLEKQQH